MKATLLYRIGVSSQLSELTHKEILCSNHTNVFRKSDMQLMQKLACGYGFHITCCIPFSYQHDRRTPGVCVLVGVSPWQSATRDPYSQ